MKLLVTLILVFSLFTVGEAFACADPGSPDTGLGCCTGDPADINGICPMPKSVVCYDVDLSPPCPDGYTAEPDTSGTCFSGQMCTPPTPPPSGGGGGPGCCNSDSDCGFGGQCVGGTQDGANNCAIISGGSDWGICVGPCGPGQELWSNDATGQTICVDICPYFEYGGPQYNPDGSCVYDGSCRGDGVGNCGSTGVVCCGAASGDAFDDGVCETIPNGGNYLQKNEFCAWNNEVTAGTHQCVGGLGIQVPYWREACQTNTNEQPTRLITRITPNTVNLVSGNPPEPYYVYTFPQQIASSPSEYLWCNQMTLTPSDENTLECPSDYEEIQPLTQQTGSCDVSYYGDGAGTYTYYQMSCRKEIPPPEPTIVTYTQTGSSDVFSLCSGTGNNPTCRAGFTEIGRTYESVPNVFCHIMSGQGITITGEYSTVTCQTTPTPPPCGNGVCASGETPASCPQDCTQTTYSYRAICSAGYTWNNAQGRCMAQCGEPGTTGTNCNDLMAPAIAGSYCSNDGNSDAVVSNPGVCCGTGTRWNGFSCEATNRCTIQTAGATGPSTYGDNSLQPETACCSIGAWNGEPNWEDWTGVIPY